MWNSNSCYEFGAYRLDTVERVLLRDGQPVPLTPKAFETLVVLVQNNGHVVEKDDLMKQVWQDTCVEEANLTQNIFTLRRVLEESSEKPKYIETVPRRGYRFVALSKSLLHRVRLPRPGNIRSKAKRLTFNPTGRLGFSQSCPLSM